MLVEGFLFNGAVAFIGYWSTVGDYEAYRFAEAFYWYVSRGYTVVKAFSKAKNEIPSVVGNVRLYGNGGMRLVDP